MAGGKLHVYKYVCLPVPRETLLCSLKLQGLSQSIWSLRAAAQSSRKSRDSGAQSNSAITPLNSSLHGGLGHIAQLPWASLGVITLPCFLDSCLDLPPSAVALFKILGQWPEMFYLVLWGILQKISNVNYLARMNSCFQRPVFSSLRRY